MPSVRRTQPINISINISYLTMSISYNGYMVNNNNMYLEILVKNIVVDLKY